VRTVEIPQKYVAARRNMKKAPSGASNFAKVLILFSSGTRTRTGDLRIMIPPL